jgi:serine protease AprX
MAAIHDRLRSAARTRIGAAFADKASPELLELLESRTRGDARGLPSMRDARTAPVSDGTAIIELDKEAQRRGAPANPAASRIHSPGERQQAIREMREQFLEEARAVVGPVVDAARTRGAAAQVEVCWLTRSIRVPLDDEVLAAAASRGNVTRVDAPRRITRDAQQFIGEPMQARAFRAARKLTGRGITVAIIDGEINASLPALFQNRVTQKNNYTPEPWGSADMHATAVAGIVGADGADLVGIAPDVALWSYKIFPTGNAASNDFAGALAVQNALEDGADVANCSWGLSALPLDGKSREVVAFDTAWSLGLILTKSSGNRGSNNVTAPADAAGVIVVGATSTDGTQISPSSSFGNIDNGEPRPHLVAPGGMAGDLIVSCDQDGNVRALDHGTSYASPHVAGAAALLLQQTPNMLPDALRAQLLAMAKPIAGVGGLEQGKGLLVLM